MPDGLLHFAFLGPGGGEMVVVMLVLLLLFGSKDAPRIFRKLSEIMNQIRSTAEHFKREVMYGDLDDGSEQARDMGDYDDYGLGHEDAEPGVAQEDSCGGDDGDARDGEPVEPESGDGDDRKN